MKNIILLLIVVLAIYANDTYSNQEQSEEKQFKCDGREHCSEMTSCEEAIFFINNCPNTKMDGDNDGKPCERRCGH